jgi:ribonuclease E
MAKRMLIDATHPEETRVAVISGNRLEEFDFESARKKQIKGNVYLAKVTRVEPSLQACFVEYGGNRHGFLAFNEIHPDYYRIPVADREALNRMVAEAMAAQEDDEEEEERRPRWRRRGRRRSSDSDEYAPAPPSEGRSAAPDDDNGVGPDERAAEGDEDPRGDAAALDMPRPERSEAPPPDGPEIEASRAEDGGRREPFGEEPEGAAPPEQAEEAPPHDDGTSERSPIREAAAGDDPAAAQRGAEERNAEDRDDEARSADADDAGAHDEPETGGHDGMDAARDAAADATAEVRPPDEAVETVGGDEVEDIRRRHRIWQRRYKIQEVIRKRQILLVQVAKEERGNKGAALTTYISLAGRYCVLMPNTPRGGGISRKITSQADRKRLKEIVGELELPDGMAVIVRTAGMERSKQELRRDLDFLLKTWEGIREKALTSTAPALIYEEANLIKRAVRDLYAKDVDEIVVDGAEGFEAARSFMRLLMPTHVKKVAEYTDKQIPLFHRYQVESQIDNMHSPSVQLRSGGYIVLNPTEALVAIDVNSGRSTRERNIEETATRTNLEAADEVARQLRLRDLAGLIVIDFIDMEEGRNRHAVERRLKEALRHDRARIQVGRISPFGLLEMSRQRLRPSLVEASMMQCPHCLGAGYVRSTESMALTVLRAVEEEGMRQRSSEVTVAVPVAVALYIFNQKRNALAEIERRHDFRVVFQPDEAIGLSTYRILRSVPKAAEGRQERAPQPAEAGAGERESGPADHRVERLAEEPVAVPPAEEFEAGAADAAAEDGVEAETRDGEERSTGVREGEAQGERRGRRRGRRGGRRRRGRQREDGQDGESNAEPPRESTLGPFGEEPPHADAPPADETPPADDAPSDERPAAADEPAKAPRANAGENEGSADARTGEAAAERTGNGAPREAAHDYAAEPRGSDSKPASTQAAAETEPAAAEPMPEPAPPAPEQPPAPPRRGWWNLRR